MTNSESRRSFRAFTVLDWIGVALAVIAGVTPLFMYLLVVPSFAILFQEFEATLPTITVLVFSGWFAPLMMLMLFGVVAAAVFGKNLTLSRIMGVLAFLLGLAIVGFYMFALYAPLMIPASLVM